jgi:hypothetical protein
MILINHILLLLTAIYRFETVISRNEYVQEHLSQDYQLLHDVLTRWSSTLLMIDWVLKLKDVNLHIIDIIYANHYIGN